jgi:hypothetical protein
MTRICFGRATKKPPTGKYKPKLRHNPWIAVACGLLTSIALMALLSFM